MTVRFAVFTPRVCAALTALAALASTTVCGAADDPGAAPKPPPLTTANPAFYVLVDSAGDRTAASVLAISVAGELNKVSGTPLDAPRSGKVWAIPESGWSPDQLVKQCQDDPNAIGGAVISYFVGDASHFWILWQTDTTTFTIFAQLVSCNRERDGARKAHPQAVAIVSQLHGSNGQLWVERKSQTSVPLLSFAAVVALLGRHYSSKSTTSSVNTSIALASVGAAVVGQGLNKDIPGYSLPLRMRTGSLHVADDLIREMRYLCGVPQLDDLAAAGHPAPPDPSTGLGGLCSQTGVTLPPGV